MAGNKGLIRRLNCIQQLRSLSLTSSERYSSSSAEIISRRGSSISTEGASKRPSADYAARNIIVAERVIPLAPAGGSRGAAAVLLPLKVSCLLCRRAVAYERSARGVLMSPITNLDGSLACREGERASLGNIGEDGGEGSKAPLPVAV